MPRPRSPSLRALTLCSVSACSDSHDPLGRHSSSAVYGFRHGAQQPPTPPLPSPAAASESFAAAPLTPTTVTLVAAGAASAVLPWIVGLVGGGGASSSPCQPTRPGVGLGASASLRTR
eukprot:2950713-Rhodomonas_salina.1